MEGRMVTRCSRRKRPGGRVPPGEPKPEQTVAGKGAKAGRLAFALRFSLISLAIYASAGLLRPNHWAPVNHLTAQSLGRALEWMGLKASVHEALVTAEGFSVRIIPECTALFACGLFLSFVLAYPSSLRKKAMGLALGIPLLVLANLVRLLAVFVTGLYARNLFEAVHVYLGQVFTVALVCLACLIWVKPPEGWTAFGEAGKRPFFQICFRFLAITGTVFIFWFSVNHHYMWLVDQIVSFVFSLFDWRLVMPRDHAVYAQTFSVVTFASLILVTRSLGARRKIEGALLGFSCLMVAHLFHRTCNVFMTAFMMPGAAQAAMALSTLAQYFLPLFLWMALTIRKPSSGPIEIKSDMRAMAHP